MYIYIYIIFVCVHLPPTASATHIHLSCERPAIVLTSTTLSPRPAPVSSRHPLLPRVPDGLPPFQGTIGAGPRLSAGEVDVAVGHEVSSELKEPKGRGD